MSSELEEEIKSLREHLRRKAVVELKQVGALRQKLQTTVGRLDTLEKDIRRDMSKAQVSGVSSMRQELYKNCWLLSKTWRSLIMSSTMAGLAIALRGSSENP